MPDKSALTYLCTDKKCRGTIYCLNTRILGGEHTRGAGAKERQRIDYQVRERRYCCVKCGKRYIGIEVLNPASYNTKPLPNWFVKQRLTP